MPTDKLNEKVNDFVLATTAGTWIVIVGIMVVLGKKMADFIYSATIGKFRSDIGKIVEEKLIPLKEEVEKYKEEIHGYREQHHGVIVKNEGVLLQALEINDEAFKKLDKFDQILKSKIYNL